MTTLLLILHGLAGVALLGALTHQTTSMLRSRAHRGSGFISRYSAVNQSTFTIAVTSLYVVQVLLGALVYPAYRLDVRIPFEEMSIRWAVGLFELKEHFAGIGLGLLPFYFVTWQTPSAAEYRRDRIAITIILAFIVWWDFLVGHVLNNIRGLG